jgi:hypothetical protein
MALERPRPLRRRHQQLASLDSFIKACYPLIVVTTHEERRFLTGVQERYGARGVYQWTYTNGLVNLVDGRLVHPDTIGDPLAALKTVLKMPQGLFTFCDLHPWLGETPAPERNAVIRLLRDLYYQIRRYRDPNKAVLLLSPVLAIPPDLEKEVVVYDFPLPDREALGHLLDEHMERARRNAEAHLMLKPEDKELLLEAALGLTLDEADNAFSAALLNDRVLDASDLHTIHAEKQLIIRKSGILDYTPVEEGMEVVGGLENLKDWLRKRRRSLTPEARAFGLPQPKGLLLTGVQGCGKSLSAKAIAQDWKLPLLRLDVGKVFGGLVGSSEENMRRAIKLAEAISPCVLWVDEIEKGFSGMQGSGASDGGTSMRVFSTFITWLQEKQSNVFVVATANQIANLPPELLRKGRFDEIFFIDLPSEAERRTIFGIHLAKRRRNPRLFDLAALAADAAGFSGAEIEQVVIAALFEAFDSGQELGMLHLRDAIRKTVPLSITMKEGVSRIRDWASQRAVNASRGPAGPA